jgi:gas vesicle protein
MTFQEGRGHHGSLASLFFPPQKGRDTETKDLQTKMNRVLTEHQDKLRGAECSET